MQRFHGRAQKSGDQFDAYDSQRLRSVMLTSEKALSNDTKEVEADVEVKHWEQRNSENALFEINQEFESQ